jgi:hypothetical protein
MAGTPAVPDMRLELVRSQCPMLTGRRRSTSRLASTSARHPGHRDDAGGAAPPPGSSCAIVFGIGMGPVTDMVPGSVKGLHLVVEDMAATRAALTERGIELSDVEDMGGVLYSYLSDPDGNMWAL